MQNSFASFAILAATLLQGAHLFGQPPWPGRQTSGDMPATAAPSPVYGNRPAPPASHGPVRWQADLRERDARLPQPQAGDGSRLPTESADRLMADMLAAVRGRESISARIRQKIDVLGEKLVGTGSYLQQGRGEAQKIRLELKIQVASQTTNMQQVCDGNFLWLQQDTLNKPTLTRIDVRRVREAMFDHTGRHSRFEQIQLALCGLPKLLESLDKSFAFKLVQSDRLDGVPVWVVRGTWRPEALAETYPDPKAASKAGQGGAAGKLPPHAPEVVVLLIGRDDLFPYRVEFRRRLEVDAKSPVRTDETRPLVIMEWFEVALDTPIDERQFIYRPGDLEFTDGTQKLLEQMGLSTQ